LFKLILITHAYQVFKDVSPQAQGQDKIIQKVVEVRNNVAHSTGGIPANTFEQMWKELVECMKGLGRDTSKLSKLRASPLSVSTLLKLLICVILGVAFYLFKFSFLLLLI
jgi:hypothetical protein